MSLWDDAAKMVAEVVGDEYVQPAQSAGAAAPSAAAAHVAQKSGLAPVQNDSIRVVKAMLAPHHCLPESHKGPLKFRDLDMRSFTLGELAIITRTDAPANEREGRMKILMQILACAENYTWESCLTFYARVLRKVEMGLSAWTDNFSEERLLCLGHNLISQQQTRIAPRKGKNTTTTGGAASSLLWCFDFQYNKCTKGDPHEQLLGGRTVSVRHICAHCAKRDRTAQPHSQLACPSYSAGQGAAA